RFVFIGAGGGALPLLQKSNIAEGKGYGGFPVGGQWLITNNPDIVKLHHAKVYGKASIGAPPMSVPHLDTRVIDGKTSLLFGPFATFSTKFLKNGQWTDMFSSLSFNNIIPMLEAGWHNLDLTKYLIKQLRLSPEERIAILREYFPNAQIKDWHLANAGQRVQIIKDDQEKGGILQFGTELVGSQDGSIIALLGASPGASTAAQIAIDIIARCFKDRFERSWRNKLKKIVPSYGIELHKDALRFKEIEDHSNKYLGL
ncbi:MAG: malate:quinone oxidoreductase, partial [Myxococcales bacterium]|nr:malate:quinone oxidoreductase [Myxococcales bacterium]